MAYATADRRSCVTCHQQRRVVHCDGCGAYFCFHCFKYHRDEISVQFEQIIVQHDHLQDIYGHQETLQEHHLFSKIGAWEHDTIAKIKQAATAARDELRQLLCETNARTNKILDEVSQQLLMAKEVKNYTEIDLASWKKRLIDIQKEFETPLQVDIVPDNDLSPIQFLKLKTIKEDVAIQSLLTSSITQSNDSLENSDISNKKSLESQLNFHDIHKQRMCFFY